MAKRKNINNKLAILKEYTKENFLISLTNKGIYNRALKDFKNIKNIKIEEAEDKIKISFDNIEIFFTESIKETKCNCPSQNICKHIIIALLYIKEYSKSFENKNSKNKKINKIPNKNIFEELNNSKKIKIKKKEKIIDDNILNISKSFIENIFAKGFYACNEKDFDKAEQIATKLNIKNMPELSKLFIFFIFLKSFNALLYIPLFVREIKKFSSVYSFNIANLLFIFFVFAIEFYIIVKII